MNCGWLVNAECCISLCAETPMSHSYGTFMISSFVTICFLPFPLRDVLLIEQYLTVNGLTLIRRNSHSLYKKKTPLGVPISIQIQLSIQGNNINHIISYHDDKVGLALSVSCRKSSASFFFFLLDLAQCTCIHAGVYEWQIAVWYPNNVGGGFSPMLREHRENCKAPPSPQSAMMDWF